MTRTPRGKAKVSSYEKRLKSLQQIVAPYIISVEDVPYGLTWYHIEQHILTPAKLHEFREWMNGQTQMMLTPECSIVYTHDLLRFMLNLPVID